MADGEILQQVEGHQVFDATPSHEHAQSDVTDLAADLGAKLTGSQQSAIADLNISGLVLIGDVITAIGTIQSKVNTLLAELRTAGVLAT